MISLRTDVQEAFDEAKLVPAIRAIRGPGERGFVLGEKGGFGERLANGLGAALTEAEDIDGRAWDYGVVAARSLSDEAIRKVGNLRGCRIICIGIPSGIDPETGRAAQAHIDADYTVVPGTPCAGLYLQDGLDAAGEIIFTENPGTETDIRLFLPEDIVLPKRRRNIHKNDCGHLLIAAGSFGMAGAAALCAKAALRSGVGLVTVACPRSIVPILQTLAPCAMCIPLPETDGAMNEAAVPVLKEALRGRTAAVCGCGLSRRASPEVVRLLLAQEELPVLFDADALNLIAADETLKAMLKPGHVITPHPGEAARLLGEKADHPIRDARRLAKLGCTALLKGASSVIASGESACISLSGGSGMARGGSGDVLSGIIGALLASEKAAPEMLALIGSEIHGLAGEAAQRRIGARAMCSADIIDHLPEAFGRFDG